MSAAEKFMFDLTFDNEVEEPLEHEESDGITTVDEEPEVIIPTFSEEDVETAKKQGFEAGKEEGLAATTEVLTKQINETLSKIDEKILTTFQTQDDVNQELARAAHSLALGICKKMMPALAKQHSFSEVGRVIDEVFAKVIEEPRITIRVHMDIAEAIKERISTLVKEKGFEGKVFVEADDALNASDCRVDWGTGGRERNTSELWAKIDSILDRNIGEKPTIWDNPEEVEINPAKVASVKDETDTPVQLEDDSLQVGVSPSENGNKDNMNMTDQKQSTDKA